MDTLDASKEPWAAMVERAQGALMGVMVADGAGANLEVLETQPTASQVEQSCGMPEGRLPAGGVTDDSELTIALALALLGDPKVRCESAPAFGQPEHAVATVSPLLFSSSMQFCPP